MENDQDPNQPILYQIRIHGRLDSQWQDWFEGLTLAPAGNDETIISGRLNDQAALYGLLKKVRDLGIPLLSVNRMEPAQTLEAEKHETKER